MTYFYFITSYNECFTILDSNVQTITSHVFPKKELFISFGKSSSALHTACCLKLVFNSIYCFIHGACLNFRTRWAFVNFIPKLRYCLKWKKNYIKLQIDKLSELTLDFYSVAYISFYCKVWGRSCHHQFWHHKFQSTLFGNH